VDFVALVEEELGQVGAVLARDACDESTFHVLSALQRRSFDVEEATARRA
jgi:hypothetical protein